MQITFFTKEICLLPTVQSETLHFKQNHATSRFKMSHLSYLPMLCTKNNDLKVYKQQMFHLSYLPKLCTKIMTSKFISSKGLNKIGQQFKVTFTTLYLFFLLPPPSYSSHNSCMLASPCGASSLSTDAWKLNHQPSQHLAIFGPHTRHHANAVWRTIHKSGIQRNEAPCRSEAQLSVDNKMSLPCTTMETSSMLKNSVKMVFHLCSISCLENNVVTMTFQTSPERTNNRNNKTKSHNFNC